MVLAGGALAFLSLRDVLLVVTTRADSDCGGAATGCGRGWNANAARLVCVGAGARTVGGASLGGLIVRRFGDACG